MPKYKNPPLVEALCEFQFEAGEPFDNTIPGLFYAEIKGEYPIKKQQRGIDFKLNQADGKFEATPGISEKSQFYNKEENALIQIGTNMLAVNTLTPYPGWEAFKPMITKHREIYQQLATPKGIKRIGLRYINKINIPEKEHEGSVIELKDYFTFIPQTPKALPSNVSSFNLKVDIPYNDGRDTIILILASTKPDKENTMAVFLDIDYSIVNNSKTALDENEWIEEAHSNIEMAFEEILTDKCRALFMETIQ
ncbi:MAG: TIGR04255 family protein [Nitrospirae bacterium]|nr:TIGR04255 family protein [Nitrospirota bacterium]